MPCAGDHHVAIADNARDRIIDPFHQDFVNGQEVRDVVPSPLGFKELLPFSLMPLPGSVLPGLSRLLLRLAWFCLENQPCFPESEGIALDRVAAEDSLAE